MVAAYGSVAVPEPVLPFYAMMFAGQSVRTVLAYTLPDAARETANAEITSWLEQRALKHPVAATYPFEQMVEAHRDVESGKRIGVTHLRIAPDAEV
jgi:NADPH:quinone reductase-like Zn-dependent oxidoreductase